MFNKLLVFVALVVGWGLCAAFNYGTTLAYFQSRVPADHNCTHVSWESDIHKAATIAAYGPTASVPLLFFEGFHKPKFQWTCQ